jgi:hypothetical protein
LFPGGIEVPFEGMKHAEQVDMTRRLISEGMRTIYEATVEHAGVFVKADVLSREKNSWLWQQKGSYSLKDVLPALVPGLSYDGLDVADGNMAMSAYRAMNTATDPSEVARIRSALLEYCKLDTLATARILERLEELAN